VRSSASHIHDAPKSGHANLLVIARLMAAASFLHWHLEPNTGADVAGHRRVEIQT